ncbi:MAG: rRNA pseudouridine synthase [Chitinophagaceae bacterium]|jgi:23S rRNA pseudouridine2605 synthase|nr:rRNA pseudouridine synthase [Chitinophagaceae bacterium]
MKRTDNFSKFAARKSNAAIKEEFRQEKKKFKKERSEAIEKKKLELRKAAAADKDVSKNRSESSDLRPAITVRKQDKTMPLNKYVAHCGICSRRDAVPLIKEGKMRVNDVVILEPGFKVNPNDVVTFAGKKILPEKNLVYILLNKPKDYITTLDDPEGRKTVLDLLRGVTAERIFPVGRLDRNTTGVLLLTNDGDLTQKLSHPSHEVRKIYEVKLDKPLGKLDFERILNGLDLEDGFVRADSLAYTDPKDKSIIGIELHSGRNRIVRRMFESLGYDVRNLDRVMFGNLTKKNVERGKWRYLVEKEIRLLKFMNSSFIKKTPEDPEEKTLVKRGQAATEKTEKKEKRDLAIPSRPEEKEKRVEIKKPSAARKQTEGRHKPTVQKGGVKRVMRSRTKK